jgi:hypothetical protein
MVGMTDIECRLHDHCEAIFGDSFKDLPSEVIGPCSEFAEEFEVIKRSFDGKNLSKTYRLRLLPLKESANINPVNYDSLEGKIIFKGYWNFQDTTVCFDLHGYRTELRDMFEHLIQKALEQVDDQIDQLTKKGLTPISMIVLAGGGGTSKYVISRFQEHCLSRLGGKVTVRRDERSWSAVTRGAATRALEGGMVISRESKRAYGFVCHQKFDEAVDDEEDSFECPVFGKRVRNCMDWLLLKVRGSDSANRSH